MSSLSGNLVRKAAAFPDSAVLFAAFAIGSALQGATFVIVSRLLGPGQFGIFAGALALASVLSTIAGFGGGNVMLMKTSLHRESFANSFGTSLSYLSLSLIPLFALSVLLSRNVGRDFIFCILLLVASECIGSKIVEICGLAFQSFDRQKWTAVLLGVAPLLRLGAALLLWITGFDTALAWSLIYCGASLLLGFCCVGFVVLLIGLPSISLGDLKLAWRTGSLFALAGFSRVVYMDADKYLLNRLASAIEAGTYSAAFKIVNFAFLPIFAFAYSKNTDLVRAGSEGYISSWRRLKKLILPVVVYGSGASLALFFLSPFVEVLLGTEYSATAAALRATCIFVLVEGVGNLFSTALMGLGRQGLRGGLQSLVAALSVAANLLLIPKLGWQGAAYTVVGSSSILTLSLAGAFGLGLRRELKSLRSQTTSI